MKRSRPPASIVEILAWSLGLGLLLMYGGVRWLSEHERRSGVEAMQQARLEHAQSSAVANVASETDSSQESKIPNAVAWHPVEQKTLTSLVAAAPDTSTWSVKRITAYLQSLKSHQLPVAVLRIPHLRLEVPVYEGTDEVNLNRGAGWIEGTAKVGSVGNVGIAAHRDGYFRPLKDIHEGDEMFLDTVAESAKYRVTGIQIVDPSDVHVLEPTQSSTITLVTCFPFYYVGNAPKRMIVRAAKTYAVSVASSKLIDAGALANSIDAGRDSLFN